jgi:Domain of unknown function (DUF4136)
MRHQHLDQAAPLILQIWGRRVLRGATSADTQFSGRNPVRERGGVLELRSLLIGACLLGVLVACLVMAGCASLRVGSDYDRNTNFANYHTYAWLPREHFGIRNPLVVRHAHEAIDAQMRLKGFVLAKDAGNADLVVDFTIGARERVQIQSYPVLYRGPWMWGRAYYGNQIDMRRYREGTLAIDVFDGRTHEPIWTGWATKQLSEKDLESSEGPAREAAAAVLARFPPQ